MKTKTNHFIKISLLLFLFLVSIGIKAQMKKGFSLSLSYGQSRIVGETKEYIKEGEVRENQTYYGYTKNNIGKTQYSVDASYQFGNFGTGFSFGNFNHEVANFDYNISIPILSEGGEVRGVYYGIGPNYSLSIGKLSMTTTIRAGMLDIKISEFTTSYNGTDAITPVELLSTTMKEDTNTHLTYGSVGYRVSYPILKNLQFFIKSDFLTSLNSGIEVTEHYYLPFKKGEGETIILQDVNRFTDVINQRVNNRIIKTRMFNIGVGVSYKFGLKKRKKRQGRTKFGNITLRKNTNKKGTDKINSANNHNTSRSNKRRPVVGDNENQNLSDSSFYKRATPANNHNTSRSNKRRPVVGDNENQNLSDSSFYKRTTPANNHNTSRSNKRRPVVGDNENQNLSDSSFYKRAAPANNHNTSRSNKRRPVVGDSNNSIDNEGKETKSIKGDLIIKSEGCEEEEEKRK